MPDSLTNQFLINQLGYGGADPMSALFASAIASGGASGPSSAPAPALSTPVAVSPVQVPPQVSTAPMTGKIMEASSRSSIDDFLSQLKVNNENNKADDKRLAWMNFFSTLASSKSPLLTSALGEGSAALTDTMLKQAANQRAADTSLAGENIKYQEWLKEREQDQQKIDQGKYSISANPFGGNPIKLNTKTGETEVIDAGQSGGAPMGDPNLTGDDFLKTLPPTMAAQVKQMAAGKERIPTGYALRNPYNRALKDALFRYNPDASEQTFPAVTKFNTGKQGDQTRAFSVAVAHLNTLSDLSDALQNSDVKKINQLQNTFKEQFGQTAPTNFDAAKQIVGGEIIKAIVNSGGGVSDRQEAQEAISKANSPDQLKGVINTYKSLIKGQLGGLEHQYKTSTGLDNFKDYLTPEATKELYPAENATASANVLDTPPPADKRTVGMVVNSPKGPVQWTGSGWIPAGGQ